MLVKIDFEIRGSRTDCLIFGHEKGGPSWKDNLESFFKQMRPVNESEVKNAIPKIIKVEQASGNSPKGFRYCRPSNWTKATKTLLPTFKEATSRTVSGVEKKYEEAIEGKGSDNAKSSSGSSRTRDSDRSDGKNKEKRSETSTST